MNYAVINDTRITNVVRASAEYAQQQGWIELPEGFGIGDLYIDGEFAKADIEPVKTVPESVSRAQGKYVLIQAGLWFQALDFVDSIEDPADQALADVALNDTQEWRRDSPFLNQCAQALGLTDELLDDLFIAAELVQL